MNHKDSYTLIRKTFFTISEKPSWKNILSNHLKNYSEDPISKIVKKSYNRKANNAKVKQSSFNSELSSNHSKMYLIVYSTNALPFF